MASAANAQDQTIVVNEFSSNFPTINVHAGANFELSTRWGRRGRIEPSLEFVNRFRMKGESFTEKTTSNGPNHEETITQSYNMPAFTNQTNVNLGLGFWLTERDRIRAVTGISPGSLDFSGQGQIAVNQFFEYLRRMQLSHRKTLDAFARIGTSNIGLPGTTRREGWISSILDESLRREFDDISKSNGIASMGFTEATVGGRLSFEMSPRIDLTAEASFGRRFNQSAFDHENLEKASKTKNVISVGVGANLRLGRTQDQFRARNQGVQRGRR